MIAAIPRIPSAILTLLLMMGSCTAWAADQVQFSAVVDRDRIALDESVALKFAIEIDGDEVAGDPSYDAPDFDVINQYDSSFQTSYYQNGVFGMRNTRKVTQVLKPLKSGTLSISNVRVQVRGKTFTAKPITVTVTRATSGSSGGSGSGFGAGTPPPKNYGGGGVGLRGTMKKPAGTRFFVRAEINKDKLYRGEQLIVSYYLYRRARVFNIQVDKFPVLDGFLREELAMPAQGQRLDSERVVLDGVPYERSLLARYAAYPLKEGKLRVDSMAIQGNYYNDNIFDQENDPISSFFQQLTPLVGTSQSDPLNVEVLSLPSEGKPANFSGGVGDFNLTSAVNKYEVRANEPITLTVKVEGRGNVAAIEEPKVKWPDQVELYESNGKAKSSPSGISEKVFEFLVIPRAPGKVTLPGVEFSFFLPSENKYVTRSTDPIEINVLEPAPGTAVSTPRAASGNSRENIPGDQKSGDDIHPPKLLAPAAASGIGRGNLLRIPFWLGGLGLLLFTGVVLSDQFRKRKAQRILDRNRKAKAERKSWRKLRERAKQAQSGAAWAEVVESYELLSGAVFDALDRKFGLGARALPRQELGRILVEERGVPAQIWQRISLLLEYAEMVRFASSTGVITEASARSELSKWVEEGDFLDDALVP